MCRNKPSYPANFSRGELLRSEVATEFGIDNSPSNSLIERNLIYTANMLQRIRDTIHDVTGVERAIMITSGYRSRELNFNRKIRGSKTSDHMRGAAADIKVAGWSSHQTVNFIIENMPELGFGQLINEYGRWVHISLMSARRKNHDVRTAVIKNVEGVMRTVYEHGNIGS